MLDQRRERMHQITQHLEHERHYLNLPAPSQQLITEEGEAEEAYYVPVAGPAKKTHAKHASQPFMEVVPAQHTRTAKHMLTTLSSECLAEQRNAAKMMRTVSRKQRSYANTYLKISKSCSKIT